jgi:hypothetical protein
MAVVRVPEIEGERRQVAFAPGQPLRGEVNAESRNVRTETQPHLRAEDPREVER